jgi:hypothetical protein
MTGGRKRSRTTLAKAFSDGRQRHRRTRHGHCLFAAAVAMTITGDQERCLRACCAEGYTPREAALVAGVSISAVRLRFKVWGYKPMIGIEKFGAMKGSVYGLPRYDGPEWIGVRAG